MTPIFIIDRDVAIQEMRKIFAIIGAFIAGGLGVLLSSAPQTVQAGLQMGN